MTRPLHPLSEALVTRIYPRGGYHAAPITWPEGYQQLRDRLAAIEDAMRAEATPDALAKAIRTYGSHLHWCRLHECDCGFVDVLRSLRTPTDADLARAAHPFTSDSAE